MNYHIIRGWKQILLIQRRYRIFRNSFPSYVGMWNILKNKECAWIVMHIKKSEMDTLA